METYGHTWTRKTDMARVSVSYVEADGTRWKRDEPYRGTAAAMQDLLSNRVQVMFDNLPGSVEHIKAGTLRAWA